MKFNSDLNKDGFLKDGEDKKEVLKPSHILTPEEILSDWGDDASATDIISDKSALDSLKKKMRPSAAKEGSAATTVFPQKHSEEAQEAKPIAQKTLLQRLKRYTTDEKGVDAAQNAAPLYELESVAEILRTDSEKTLKALSEKYNITVDDLGKRPKQTTVKEEAEPQREAKPTDSKPTPSFEKMVSNSEKRFEEEIRESLFEEKKNAESETISIPNISDIDTQETGVDSDNADIDINATVRFVPIKDEKGNTGHISISSTTRPIEIPMEFEDVESQSSGNNFFGESDFEKYKAKNEIENQADAKREIRALSIKKRSAFLSCCFSALMSIALLLFAIPPLSALVISNPRLAMILCVSFLSAQTLANISMFCDFANIPKRKCTHDILLAFSSLCTIALGIYAITASTSVYPLMLLCGLGLFIRSLCRFGDASARLLSLKQISHPRDKKAISIISDGPTAFAMAKNSIEGDVLIAAPRKTDFVADFVKYNEFHKKLSGNLIIIFIVCVILTVASGLAAQLYFDSAYHGLYTAATISLIAALPTLIFIDSLPLYLASRRLRKKRATLMGITAVERLELANAAVIATKDIFPSGTIVLKDMKVLCANSIDDTIMKAAALTSAVGSPLESIFKRIAGTNTSYLIPDADTVKYEERLGISGWVGDERLFIGNRTLLESHGIEAASIEVDRKILRQGYFPVYVATEGKACALIVIEYNIDDSIAKELRKITKLGVTLLIDNCDPNVSESMICDYFGLYDDSIKVMTNAGVHMYKNATTAAESISAPAAFLGGDLTTVTIMNSASAVKKLNLWLTVIYTVCSVFGALAFIYTAFSGGAELLKQTTVLAYSLITTAISLIAAIIKKP